MSPADPPAIAVEKLTKLYRGVTAVDGISFSIPRGTITGILGGNGAGKTTTIGMILGLILPTSGTIRVLGHDIGSDRHAVLHRMNFESPYVALPGRLTVRQNLRVFAKIYGVPQTEARIGELAEELDLTNFIDRETGQLSAGQKTRVAIAKALVNAPDVLLLDEPTASLDPDTGDWIRSRLQTYSQARSATILLASHNMIEVERLCDDVIMMKEGKIVDRAAPQALIDKYGRTTLEDVFLDVARGRGRAGLQAEAS
jgi:ABC-2 type transport system ATP-binding protein